jgi:hypothetical protein
MILYSISTAKNNISTQKKIRRRNEHRGTPFVRKWYHHDQSLPLFSLLQLVDALGPWRVASTLSPDAKNNDDHKVQHH